MKTSPDCIKRYFWVKIGKLRFRRICGVKREPMKNTYLFSLGSSEWAKKLKLINKYMNHPICSPTGGDPHAVEHSDCGSGKARAWKQDLSHFFGQCEDGYCQHSGYGHNATCLQCEGPFGTDGNVFTFYFTTFFHHVQATREQWVCPSCSMARLLVLSTVTWPPEVRKSSGEVVSLSSWQPLRPSSHGGIWL